MEKKYCTLLLTARQVEIDKLMAERKTRRSAYLARRRAVKAAAVKTGKMVAIIICTAALLMGLTAAVRLHQAYSNSLALMMQDIAAHPEDYRHCWDND